MKPKNTKKTVILLILTLAVLLVGTLGAYGYAAYVRRGGEDGAVLTGAGLSEDRMWRFLIAGTDRTSGLCDVLILASLEPSSGRVNLLQLPRDTFAVYDEGSYCKLNGAMQSLGGMEALCDYIGQAFSVTVDRYVCMDPDALRMAVDLLGGVEITLAEPMEYSDPAQGLTIRLPAGAQTLDGEAAEQFVRYRSGYENGDLGRLDAQKLFLAAFLRTFRQKASLPLLIKLASAVPEHTETNLSLSELIFLGKTALSSDGSGVTFFTLPGEACTVEATGASYFVLSASAAAELLEMHFGREGDFDREQVFRHHRNPAFCAIYDGYTPYSGVSLGDLMEKTS